MALLVKNLPTSAGDAGDTGSTPVLNDPVEEAVTTDSSILACRIPWTEEPGGLQCMGFQRIGHN